jgi:hypothetical protein
MQISEFIDKHNLKLTKVEYRDSNPNFDDSDMDHWTVTLKHGRKQMSLPFSKGTGHHGREPELDEVLDCLISDANSVRWENFEGFAANMGYDSDSRKAEKIYKACERSAKRLEKFLGDAYEEALDDVEGM